MGKKLLEFFIYSNLFIAGCAVLMVDQTSHLLLATHVSMDYILFVLFSTICSYSFHGWFTEKSVHPSPRIGWMQRYRWIHALFFVTGLAGSAFFFTRLLDWWHLLATAALMTFLYSAPKIPHPVFRALRKVALGKTIFLAAVWTIVTTVNPLIMDGGEWFTPYTLFIIHRFFLVYAICILFDLRDRDDDKATGVRSLVTYLDERGIFVLFVVSLVAFTVANLALRPYLQMIELLILFLPGVIVGALYRLAKKNFSDLLYYGILDGLMALSALLLLLRGYLFR